MDLNAIFQVCLFNIAQDPCELDNLVFKYPDIVRVNSVFFYNLPFEGVMELVHLMIVAIIDLDARINSSSVQYYSSATWKQTN